MPTSAPFTAAFDLNQNIYDLMKALSSLRIDLEIAGETKKAEIVARVYNLLREQSRRLFEEQIEHSAAQLRAATKSLVGATKAAKEASEDIEKAVVALENVGVALKAVDDLIAIGVGAARMVALV